MRLYNTLTKNTEDLLVFGQKKITFYSCGLTVYSQPHIGNWVGYLYWDVLVRTLIASGIEVERTQNYTDVGHLVSDDDGGEDKMEKGAKKEGLTAWQVAEKYTAIADHEAYDLLGMLKPTHIARATDYIAQQIAFVQQLEEKGFTYIIPEEGVYFDTSKISDYGKLAQLDIDGLEAGARVAVTGKKHVTDFALWKFSPKTAKRDMEWQSPWGIGFPGWHLECSVIAKETLGDQIDLHAGGIDHIPVHHTNEIAQTEAVTGKQFAKVWVHNNHLKVNGGKMAKSLGNVYTLADITAKNIPLEAFKVFVYGKHYRTEGNFTWENLQAAHNRLQVFSETADLIWQPLAAKNTIAKEYFSSTYFAILQSLQSDLDTPQALLVLHELCDTVKAQLLTQEQVEQFKKFLLDVDDLLALGLSRTYDLTSEQKDLLSARKLARDNKDWQQADTIRDELLKQSIAIRDTPHGVVWYRLLTSL